LVDHRWCGVVWSLEVESRARRLEEEEGRRRRGGEEEGYSKQKSDE
jgi:hypothetical protein